MLHFYKSNGPLSNIKPKHTNLEPNPYHPSPHQQTLGPNSFPHYKPKSISRLITKRAWSNSQTFLPRFYPAYKQPTPTITTFIHNSPSKAPQSHSPIPLSPIPYLTPIPPWQSQVLQILVWRQNYIKG
jgi:hypothetical protein